LLSMDSEIVHSMPVKGASCTIAVEDGATWLRVQCDSAERSEIILAAPDGHWNLSSRQAIEFNARNCSDKPIVIRACAQNAGGEGLSDTCCGIAELTPGEEGTVIVPLTRRPKDPGFAVFESFYMYSTAIQVRDNTVDPARIARVGLLIDHPVTSQALGLSK